MTIIKLMLTHLHIKNFALMEELEIEFSPKMNVLTGETGAGKSILIDAIRFALGERMEGVRGLSGELSSSVEAMFEGRDLPARFNPAFQDLLESEDESLILRREHLGDRTRCWVNGRTVTLGILKTIGAGLIDIHGQYDHQLLLEVSSHVELVDRFAKIETLLESYAGLYREYQALQIECEELDSLESGRERELDLLRYQIDEIEKAKLRNGEEEEIQNERLRLANAEKLHEQCARILAVLDEDEQASSLLGLAARDLGSLVRLDPSMEAVKTDFESVQLSLEELIRTFRDYRDRLSFDPERLEELNARLDVLDLLKRKYGGSLGAVLQFHEESRRRFDQLQNATVVRSEIDQKIRKLLVELKDEAQKITEKRKRAGASLKKTIEEELKDLGIPNVRFECQVEPAEFHAGGSDRLEFMIRINEGQPLMPLRKIISAGEVSRVMLALKKALMKVDPVPTLVFDEIDANIGGRLGTVTGRKLREIAGERQVLLITHLPQIASFADRHFKVAKGVRKGKSVTQYQRIEGEDRVRELAQMMSGKQETDISLRHAKEMLEQGKEK